jgi:hypothetical protein
MMIKGRKCSWSILNLTLGYFMRRQVIALAALTVTVIGNAGVGFAAPAKKADAPKVAAKAKAPEKKVAKTEVATASVPGEEVVYKIKLRADYSGSIEDATSDVITGGLLGKRSSWVVVRVNGNKVNLLHSTRLGNLLGQSRWYDHKVVAIRMCEADVFEDVENAKKSCKTVKSDTIEIPAGKSVYDMSFDFRYVEGGAPYMSTVQVSTEMQPEPPEGQKNCKNGLELCMPK